MRIITDKEDKLLEKINYLQEQIKLLDIEEIELKGTLNEIKEKRQSEFTKIMFWIVISTLGFILTMGYVIVGYSQPVLAAALFFAAGGIGFIILAVWLFTFFMLIGYVNKTSKIGLIKKSAQKENFCYIEEQTRSKISQNRNKTNKYKTNLEITKEEYNDLKYELDSLYDSGKISDRDLRDSISARTDLIWQGNKYASSEIIKGNESSSFDSANTNVVANYQTYEPWTSNDSPKGKYNKLRAELIRIQNTYSQYEEEVFSYEFRQHNAKKTIIYIVSFLCILVISIIIVVANMASHSDVTMDLKVLACLGVVTLGMFVIAFLALAFVIPSVSEGKIASAVVKLTGNEHIQAEINRLKKEMNDIDKRVIEIKEDMRLLKTEFDKE